jgi:hypothetical protein
MNEQEIRHLESTLNLAKNKEIMLNNHSEIENEKIKHINELKNKFNFFVFYFTVIIQHYFLILRQV